VLAAGPVATGWVPCPQPSALTALNPPIDRPPPPGISPPGSALTVHNSTQEIIDLVATSPAPAAYAPFPPDLVATWRAGFPLACERSALAARLAAAGWPRLPVCTSRARIAAEIVCGGAGGCCGVEEVAACCDFEGRPDVGRDRWAVFAVALK